MKMPFLMQVVLLGFISNTSCVFRLPVSPPGLPPAYLTNKPPLLFTDENDECQAEPDPPPSVADHFIAWQPRTTTSAASLQKPSSPGGQSGHATASNAIMKMPFLMQVSYLQHANSFRSSDSFLLTVSGPPDNLDCWRRWLRLLCESLCSFAVNAHLVCLLLMLAGDIESNTGPSPHT
ncbi:hypothetical protein MRX96_057313 [Rhipicephalus microplus]